MASLFYVFRNTGTVVLMLAGIIILVLMYCQSYIAPKCHPTPAHSKTKTTNSPGTAVTQQEDKPVLLLWFWPEDKMFDLKDCKTLFKIDGCHVTADRSLYSIAHGVLVYHKAIHANLSNLPTSARARFQRWIWFNTDSPTNTRKIAGIETLFNLTMNYRKDADIQDRWRLSDKKDTDEDFVLPKKERLLCWFVDNDTKSLEGYNYYKELIKHIKVDLFYGSSAKGENYFKTISSCKFYLSFENSIHRDYITETFNGPLAAGSVPIVFGPPRRNYEDFAPGSSFIHVNDFPDATTLVRFLLRLENDNEAYMRYFDWRRFYTAKRYLNEEKFAHAICQACHFLSINNDYRVLPDLYKWFFL